MGLVLVGGVGGESVVGVGVGVGSRLDGKGKVFDKSRFKNLSRSQIFNFLSPKTPIILLFT